MNRKGVCVGDVMELFIFLLKVYCLIYIMIWLIQGVVTCCEYLVFTASIRRLFWIDIPYGLLFVLLGFCAGNLLNRLIEYVEENLEKDLKRMKKP